MIWWPLSRPPLGEGASFPQKDPELRQECLPAETSRRDYLLAEHHGGKPSADLGGMVRPAGTPPGQPAPGQASRQAGLSTALIGHLRYLGTGLALRRFGNGSSSVGVIDDFQERQVVMVVMDILLNDAPIGRSPPV